MTPSRLIAAIVGLSTVLSATTAAAQSLNLGGDDSREPIEIYADNGIEWQQENLIFLARGNARAVRGEITVYGDVLRAHYRELKTAGGGTEIQRLVAEGNVRIVTPGETAYGQRAVYSIDIGVLVLSGGTVRLVAGEDVITADSQLEYWEAKQLAVARGNATAVRKEKLLRAEILVAYFRSDESGKSAVYRIEAFDDVKIVTAQDTATAQRGVYNVESGIATLLESVRIVRDGNVLDGCRAEVNLNTGVSKLFGCGERVKGVIIPRADKKKKKK